MLDSNAEDLCRKRVFLRLLRGALAAILAAMDIVKEKIKQAGRLLDELDLDLWLIFARETAVTADPVMPLMVGHEATWQSFFAYTRTGEAYALIGNFDEPDYVRSGRFTEVIPYTEGVRADFRKLLKRLNPGSIAINYSTDNPSADGLTHGLYLKLLEYLAGTPFDSRLVSAAELCTKLRSRKTATEISRLETAAIAAGEIWHDAVPRIKVGMSEIEIGALLDGMIRDHGGEPSFETIVNAGDKTSPGHGTPTDAILEPGDLLHVDFGARIDDYCSDIQRLLYFRRPREDGPPNELVEAFDMVSSIITRASETCVPGIKGYEVDAEARASLVDNGYEVYQHALGHQLGRAVHDGGALLGPQWERYGETTSQEVEEGNAFTLELEIILPGIGCVGLEEDVIVEANGARFMGPRQRELDIK